MSAQYETIPHESNERTNETQRSQQLCTVSDAARMCVDALFSEIKIGCRKHSVSFVCSFVKSCTRSLFLRLLLFPANTLGGSGVVVCNILLMLIHRRAPLQSPSGFSHIHLFIHSLSQSVFLACAHINIAVPKKLIYF